MKVVVGLGNPGEQYANTPHSIGFEVVDELAAGLDCRLRKSFWFRAKVGKAVAGGGDVLLVKPQTYMNASGSAVSAILRYHKALPSDMIVVLDDADLDVGTIRIKPKGSSGGHKGLLSVENSVGTKDFVRVRLGIGRSNDGADLVNHVLDHFKADERTLMSRVVKEAAGAVLCVLESGIDRAMNEYNAKQVE